MSEKAMSSAARERVKTFNKHVLNPAMLLLAGRKHWYAGVIRHTGRRTGKSYATPIVADRVSDGFIVPLPYGTGVDWLRNVAAEGGATLTVGGQTFDVTQPDIIDAEAAAAQLEPRRYRTFRRFDIDTFLKLSLAQ